MPSLPGAPLEPADPYEIQMETVWSITVFACRSLIYHFRAMFSEQNTPNYHMASEDLEYVV